MNGISWIEHRETARVDRDHLEALVMDHGQQGAERLMGRVLEDLAVRLNKADRSARRGDLRRLSVDAQAVSALARDVGLIGLVRAANAVAEVAGRGDPAALAATMGRMLRIGEASLMSAWDLEGQSF